MATATQPETTSQFSLTNPPPGFYFDWDEVKGDHGQKSFGQRPLLSVHETPEGVQGMITFYGNEGVARIYNGTSGRVQAQGIARRVTLKGQKATPPWSDEQINNEIAKAQLEYRPGKRQGGQSTAQSRAVNAAKKAAGKISGDALAGLMEKIAGMSDAEREAFGSQFGINFAAVTANGTDEDEGDENENEDSTEGQE